MNQTSIKNQPQHLCIRRIACGLFVLSMFFFHPVAASSRETAVGLIFVEPTGISAKIWNAQSGWAGAFGWIPGTEESIRIQIDHLLNHIDLLEMDRSDLRFYYGIGGRLLFRNGIRTALRFPFGLDLVAAGRHANFFIEGVPVFQINPKVLLFIRAGVGLRYVF